MQNERFFNFGLRVFILESEKFEHVRIFDFFFRRDRIFVSSDRGFGKHLCFAARKRGAVVKQRVDLAIELSHAPAAAQRFRLIKLPRLFVFYRQ